MVKNVLIDTINIKKFLVLNPDDGHVNHILFQIIFMEQELYSMIKTDTAYKLYTFLGVLKANHFNSNVMIGLWPLHFGLIFCNPFYLEQFNYIYESRNFGCTKAQVYVFKYMTVVLSWKGTIKPWGQ